MVTRDRNNSIHEWSVLRQITLAALLVVVAMCGLSGSAALAADFDMASPSIELRRLQKCEHCSEDLIVTTIAPGAAVRCPKCRTVQKRLPDSELRVKVYQVCPACGSRLDVSGLKPNAPFKCGSCGLAQRVDPHAVYIPESGAGTGTIPDGPVISPKGVKPATDKPGAKHHEPVVPGLNRGKGAIFPPRNRAGDALPDKSGQESGATESLERLPASAAVDSAQIDDINMLLPQSGESLSVAVYVNGKGVPESMVRQAMRRNLEILRLNNGHIDRKAVAGIRKKIINGLVERELVLQAAAKERVRPRKEQVLAKIAESGGLLTYASASQEVIIDTMRQRYATPDRDISEAQAVDFYKKNKDMFSGENAYKIRCLTIFAERAGRADPRKSDQIAQDVQHKLEYNVDFAALVKRFSEGPFRDEGGLLRGTDGEYVKAGELNNVLRKKLATMQKGNVAGPLRVPGCLVFIRLEDIIAGKQVPYAAVRQQVREKMRLNADDLYFKRWVESLRRAALVEFPKHLQADSNAQK